MGFEGYNAPERLNSIQLYGITSCQEKRSSIDILTCIGLTSCQTLELSVTTLSQKEIEDSSISLYRDSNLMSDIDLFDTFANLHERLSQEGISVVLGLIKQSTITLNYSFDQAK